MKCKLVICSLDTLRKISMQQQPRYHNENCDSAFHLKRKTIGSSLERQLDHGCLRQTGNPGAWQRGKWDGHRRVAPRNHWHFWMAGGHWETQLLCLWAPSQSPLYGWWFGGFPPGAAPAALSGSAELRFGSRTHTEIINHTHSCATS